MNRIERIAALDQQLANMKERNRRAETVLRNRKQRLENAESARERKLETRRKILIGQAVLHEIHDNPLLHDWFFTRFHLHLVSERERKLFQDFGIDNHADPDPEPPAPFPLRRLVNLLSSLSKRVLPNPSKAS